MNFMMKKDLLDMTFLIPVRVDSIIRIENLLASIHNIQRSFKTHIMVLEAEINCNGVLKKILPKNVEYIYVKDNDPIFYRTHFLNIMTQKAKTDYLAIWDADIIIPARQIYESVQLLRTNKCDVVYPYDGKFADVTTVLRELYIEILDVRLFTSNESKMIYPYGLEMLGGAIFVNRQKYISAGMENEKFYGWGPEDGERYYRWRNHGYTIERVKGKLFHLTHPRNINGRYNSDLQKKNLDVAFFQTLGKWY